ncbi:hypothetical protein SLEP1_g21171 [Rubroshorea leprosula]|uniref:Reverse transcriptase Ty1/copia-type domain-containing protein n=1 Tax=Rubroshorea leprosula TaxID=152421 RepID=A0AAV5J541_9ROSI|nr:hypothetical protein SLEP1_g21171 [Rubroshorea leprosula]
MAFTNHLAECGIKQQVSCPGTPEQNGVAERKHRHIVETVPPPSSSTNIVGSKWVFKTKLHPDGSIERFKAHLVAKGFSQIPGVDFDETFSPVLKPTTLRLVIALATTLNWSLRQLDVKNAFLHGKLKETVYMTQPPGFEDPKYPNHVCKLNKSIYGLKQAPRAWFDTFTLHLLKMGFSCSRADSSLFVLHNNQGTTLLMLYVDNIVLTASSKLLLQSIIDHLSKEFALKDLGQLSYFLGIEVTPFDGGTPLSQAKYATDLLTRSSMLEASTIATPLATKDTTTLRDMEPVNAKEYRKIVGALQYLTITRTDICHAVNKVCQFIQNPTLAHLRQVKRILRYINGCVTTRRSTTGYCVFLGANCISWSSKKQPTVARSTAEAEYRALASATAEIVWITYILRDIGISLPSPPQLFSDNISALHMSINPVFHARTKHIELDYHFVREKVAIGEDIDPSLYEVEISGLSSEEFEEIRRLHASDTVFDREKDSIELKLAKLCLERNIPYLGICRHAIKVVENIPLHELFNDSLEEEKMEIWVNAYHQQGVKRLAQRFVPMAFAPDGLIEGFYDPDAYNPDEGKFIMGLQFHPERMRRPDSDEFDYPGCPSAYQEFVKAVIAYQKKLNSTTSVPKPLKLNQEMEKKRKMIIRSFSLAENLHSTGSEMHPSKESELQAGAEFLESNIDLSIQQENRLKQMGATVRNGGSYIERLKQNEERERFTKNMMGKISAEQLMISCLSNTWWGRHVQKC